MSPGYLPQAAHRPKTLRSRGGGRAGRTRDDGHLAEQALRDAGDEHDALEPGLHLGHQRLVLLVLGLVVHQRAALALPARAPPPPVTQAGSSRVHAGRQQPSSSAPR
jgi:hypothetical protein